MTTPVQAQQGDFDAELDLGSSPIPTEDEHHLLESEVGDSDLGKRKPYKKMKERDFGRVIEEIEPIDPYRHALGAFVGLMTNFDFNENIKRYTGGGFRYGFKLINRLIFRGANVQDQLFIEGSASFYKVLGFQFPDDSYSVINTTISGRYAIMFSRDFGILGYLGTTQNIAFAGAEGTEESLSILNSTIPAFGFGLLIGIGPNWELRTDFGIDQLSAGLVIRF
jgi:hypothetical protein